MNYQRENLIQLNIHTLRSIAREFGVKSPTTLNKDSLINEILLISQGKKQPHTPTKKGRPPKTNKLDAQNFSALSPHGKEQLKKEFIASILKEVEKKLNELL